MMADDLSALMQQSAEAEADTFGFGEADLAKLSNVAKTYFEEKALLERQEQDVKDTKERIRTIQEKTIPDMMEEAGMQRITLTDGSEVTVSPVVYCSIPDENKPAAYAWLGDNGHGSIVKHVIAAAFGKGEDDKAAEAKKVLEDAKIPYVDTESVHHQTLQSWAREEVGNGRYPPDNLFNVHEANVAKIKPRK